MRQHFLHAFLLTIVSIVVLVGGYTLIIWGVAQFSPGKGDGETVMVNDKVVGYQLEGQKFTDDTYFYSRPSSAGYDASASSGSNKGPSNPDYLKSVESLIDTFLVHNPSVKREDIPSELVTGSGSGLDPDISPEGALIQIPRIAHARHIPSEKIAALVSSQIQQPFLGIFGPQKVNVLRLNIALNNLR